MNKHTDNVVWEEFKATGSVNMYLLYNALKEQENVYRKGNGDTDT